MRPTPRLLSRIGLGLFIAWCLSLPLSDILRYPDRVSVLPNLQTDAGAYDAIARDLARTRSLDALPPKHPPGWVTLLAFVYSVAGPSFVAGKSISWAALIVSVAVCAWLARRMYGARAAWVAALLCAASPALRGYVGTLQYEVITGTLMIAMLALAVHAIDATNTAAHARRAALAGVVAAILVLTRETFALVVPLVALWMAPQVSANVGRRPAALSVTLLIGIAAAPAVAWSAVQSIREGHLITISEKGPMVVELGNNPRANGTYNAPLVGIGQPTGLAFVRQFPERAAVLAVRKVLYFWGVLRDGWNVPRPSAVWIWRATTGLLPLSVIEPIVRGGWLLVAFLFALWFLRAAGLRQWWIFPMTVLTVLAVHVATLASYRFAVPVLPVVYVLVSGPLARLAVALGSTLRAPAVAIACGGLVAIIVAMQFQQWPLSVTYEAVDLDGADARNEIDQISGTLARVADARGGIRPAVLLPDEYLPAGALTVTVRARRLSTPPAHEAAAIRTVLFHLDGRPACLTDLPARELPIDRFDDFAVPCRLTRDGPATLIVYTLGVVDLAVERVNLSWTGAP